MYVLWHVKAGAIKMFNFIFIHIMLENHTLNSLRSNIFQSCYLTNQLHPSSRIISDNIILLSSTISSSFMKSTVSLAFS
jgi:hypothetical protein